MAHTKIVVVDSQAYFLSAAPGRLPLLARAELQDIPPQTPNSKIDNPESTLSGGTGDVPRAAERRQRLVWRIKLLLPPLPPS